MLGLAAKERGLKHVLNGEGGDQLFGGWTNKPMIAAEIFGGIASAADTEESREETYLRSYHRFYGAEDALYTDMFREAVGGPGQRRAHLAPYLSGERGESFLNRVRLADIALKGSQNILPRAERIAAGLGLTVSMPLFDRKLAEFSFRLPSEMKLHGACEKFVLKIAMQGRLPEDIIWRKKSGMSVPMTDWPAFAAAIDRVSAHDAVRFTAANLYYELARTKRSKVGSKVIIVIVGIAIAIVAAIVGASSENAVVLVVGLLVGLAVVVWGLLSKPRATPAFSSGDFETLLGKWKKAHGTPPKLVHRIAPDVRNESRALPRELATYSFDRAVICDRPETRCRAPSMRTRARPPWPHVPTRRSR